MSFAVTARSILPTVQTPLVPRAPAATQQRRRSSFRRLVASRHRAGCRPVAAGVLTPPSGPQRGHEPQEKGDRGALPAVARLLAASLVLASASTTWAEELAPSAEATPSAVDFELTNYVGALVSAAVAEAGADLGTLLAQGATLFVGSLVGGAVAWQLATMQAQQRAEEQARAKTRDALSALDPESLTSVLGELPSWLAYRDFERAGWLNRVLVKAWPYLDQATSGVIVAALAPILEVTRPTFLTSLKFERFSFGSIPARIEGVKVYDVDGEDAVEIDLEVFWKGDPDVVLGVRAAQDAVRVPVSLTEVQVSGTVRLTFGPLLPKFPCFGAISVTLMGKPTLAFDLRVVGSDITLVPGVAQILRSYFKGLLAAYLVWPRRITVAIPGTGYTLREDVRKAAGTLHVRLLGATGVLAAANSNGASSSTSTDGDGEAPISNRLRLGSDAVLQVRYMQAPPSGTDADAVAVAAAAAAMVRTAPPQVVRPGGSVTLAVDDPNVQGVWLGIFDRTVEDKGAASGPAVVSDAQVLGDLALGGGAALLGECFIPIALCADQREGETVQCTAELSSPPARSGTQPSAGALAAVARRGGVQGWAASVGGAAWGSVTRGAGAVASATVSVTRGVGGAWNESVRALQKDGWGGITRVPGAVASGYVSSAFGSNDGQRDGSNTAGDVGPPVSGAQQLGPAWVLWTQNESGVANVQVLAPARQGQDAGSQIAGNVLLELRYETGAASKSSAAVPSAGSAAPVSNGAADNAARQQSDSTPAIAIEVIDTDLRDPDWSDADDEVALTHSVTIDHANAGGSIMRGTSTQGGGASVPESSRATSLRDKLRRLRLAASAAALALSSPEATAPEEDRAKLAALLEQAERLVSAAEAEEAKDSSLVN